MDLTAIGIVALCLMGFGMVSGRVENSIFTPPMVFLLIGLLVSHKVLGWVHFDIENSFIHGLAELTLILVLFTDASRIDLGLLRREHDLPMRLLIIGLPLTIISGTFAAYFLFPQLDFWQAAVLAAILSPTDAALGQAVVSSRIVPVRIRQTLNVESGLNDGIVLPVLLILLSLADATSHPESTRHWIQFAALQVVLGPLMGVAVGYAGGRLVSLGARSGWMNQSFQDLSALGLSLLAFAAAELIGGNGFIAAFCAGLTLGNTSRAICTCLYEFAEAEGQLLALLIFMVFGAVMVPKAMEHMGWYALIYAVSSLTVIRMVPVILSLVGCRLRLDTTLFLAWFGPRGIASILFVLLMLERSNLAAGQSISSVVVLTVFLSILAHGITAYPFSVWYASRVEALKPKPGVVEHMLVTEMPVRIPFSRKRNE